MEEQKKLGVKLEEKIDSIEGYKFEAIKGYPMLHWQGKRPFTSTQFYPAQLKEIHGKEVDRWMNKIFWGDNLQVMSHLLKSFRSQIDFAYIDPPFDSKADYKKTISLKGKQASNDQTSFEEKQYTDIWTNDGYLQFMYERLILIRELMDQDGVLAVHCDVKRGHYLKIILDEIFGIQNFRNEIIVRTGVKNVQAQFETIDALSLGNNSIYLYSKSPSRRFELLQTVSEDYSPGKWDTFWRGTDRPTMRYELFGKTPEAGQWRWEKNRAKEAVRAYEEFVKEHSSTMTLDEYYLKELEGGIDKDFVKLSEDNVVQYFVPPRKYKMASSVWLDIPYKGNVTDYPTEKNESILERLIKWITRPSDIVFDCFMGSGTTQAVALKLGRKFIGADINLGAIQTTSKRLLNVISELTQNNSQLQILDETTKIYAGFEAYNVNHYDVFRNPIQAKDLLMKALEIQTLPGNSIYDGEKDGMMVRVMPVNRIATRVDLNDLITGFDYKTFEKRNEKNPGRPVEQILLVCMGHEPDLGAYLKEQVKASGYLVDVEVVDILRANANLEFKRDSEAEVTIEGEKLVIRQFYPMNLLQKMSLIKENVGDWRELVESVMIDFNYDGAVLEPQIVDVPEGKDLVIGFYEIPAQSGTIRIKITDLLSESLEVTING